ncbi:CmcJ/NvfI family oxidoreductase [Pseudomonas aeruginosa]
MGCQQHAWPAHAPEQVEAEVNYIRDNGQRPVAYTYPAPAGTPQRAPLALLDARSLAFDDLVASDLVYRDKVGETYSVKPNPEHRWYYYPRLLPEEALLLKIYDSREDAQARLGAHTAFDDPCTPADAPPRQSIELRCLLFFDE